MGANASGGARRIGDDLRRPSAGQWEGFGTVLAASWRDPDAKPAWSRQAETGVSQPMCGSSVGQRRHRLPQAERRAILRSHGNA